MRAYALVLARSGSKGVPHKNIRPIAGHPLMAYSIAFAKKISVERIIVSTDSSEYRNIALRYGGECPYLRGAAASTDTALDELILADLADNLPRCGIALPDIWVRLKPTTPFRTVRSVETALGLLRNDDTIDSVRIVSASEARLHVIGADGYLRPLLPDWDPNRSIIARAELPVGYSPFNLHVFRHAGWVARGAGYMGRRIVPIVEHKVTGIDLDSLEDFEIAEALMTLTPRPPFLQAVIHEPR